MGNTSSCKVEKLRPDGLSIMSPLVGKYLDESSVYQYWRFKDGQIPNRNKKSNSLSSLYIVLAENVHPFYKNDLVG
jgi:hypothetical protein